MARKRLGELLLERGAISPAQLEAALTTQRTTRARLGTILVDQGALSEEALCQVLSEALRIPQVDLSTVQPEWGAVHSLRARFCDQHALFPYALQTPRGGRKVLSVAITDPLNVPAIEEIEFTTGLKVQPRLATPSAVKRAILRWYHKVDPDQVPGEVVRPGGGALHVVDEEEDVTLSAGEPLPADWVPEDDEALVVGTPAEPASRRSVDRDLAYLVGGLDVADPVEELERKFWALLRIMARKGLLTAEEFKKELEAD